MSRQNPTILERIDLLEKASEQLYKLFEANFTEVRKTLASFTETMSAIMAAQGPDFEPKVLAELKKIRTTRLEAENTRNKAVIDQLLDNKVIEPVTAIGTDSIVTGRYLDKSTGEVVEPGYQQLEAKHLTEEAQKALHGQSAGFTYEVPGGNTGFEVTGVYQYVKTAVKAEGTSTQDYERKFDTDGQPYAQPVVELKEPETTPPATENTVPVADTLA